MQAKTLRNLCLDIPLAPSPLTLLKGDIARIDRQITAAMLGPTARRAQPGPVLQNLPTNPSPDTALTMDKLRTAMAMMRGPYRDDPREIHARAMEDAYRSTVRRLDTDRLPSLKADRLEDIDPTVKHTFLWGPNGEWTGWPVLDHLLPRELEYRGFCEGAPMRGLRRDYRISATYHDPYGGRLSHQYASAWQRDRIPIRFDPERDGCYRLVRFTTYEDLVDYGHEIAGELGFRARDGALIYELATALSSARLDIKSLEFWTDELRRSRRKYGYGVMRDGADQFDPWGVLADVVGVEWTWDDDEEGYAAGPGEVLFPSREHVRRWLGAEGPDKGLDHLIELVTELGDRCSQHKDIAELLTSAAAIVREKLRLIKAARDTELRFVGDLNELNDDYGPEATINYTEEAFGAPGHRRIMRRLF